MNQGMFDLNIVDKNDKELTTTVLKVLFFIHFNFTRHFMCVIINYVIYWRKKCKKYIVLMNLIFKKFLKIKLKLMTKDTN